VVGAAWRVRPGSGTHHGFASNSFAIAIPRDRVRAAGEAVGRPEQRALLARVQAVRRDDAGDAFAVDRDPDLRARGKGTATARRTITTEA
jgi:hypothetical protein